MGRWLRRCGWTLIGMGSFVLYFLVYQLVGTGAAAATAQSDLRQNLERQWASAPGTPVAASAAKPPPPPRRAAPGQAFALIKIPKIDVERVLVEGVEREQLRKGPGHVPTTVMPGQPGTFGVSGHRTTYGAPFFRLNELGKGDRIQVVTEAAVYMYTVSRTAIVRPTDVWVLDNVRARDGSLKATITLTTCHPRYSAKQRLIVFGDLASASRRGASTAT
ncbi:MAG TPA: class E sortase [Actinomycetes bacterium]|nr:class E sortase [Actinomycetes bacterium]